VPGLAVGALARARRNSNGVSAAGPAAAIAPGDDAPRPNVVLDGEWATARHFRNVVARASAYCSMTRLRSVASLVTLSDLGAGAAESTSLRTRDHVALAVSLAAPYDACARAGTVNRNIRSPEPCSRVWHYLDDQNGRVVTFETCARGVNDSPARLERALESACWPGSLPGHLIQFNSVSRHALSALARARHQRFRASCCSGPAATISPHPRRRHRRALRTARLRVIDRTTPCVLGQGLVPSPVQP